MASSTMAAVSDPLRPESIKGRGCNSAVSSGTPGGWLKVWANNKGKENRQQAIRPLRTAGIRTSFLQCQIFAKHVSRQSEIGRLSVCGKAPATLPEAPLLIQCGLIVQSYILLPVTGWRGSSPQRLRHSSVQKTTV